MNVMSDEVPEPFILELKRRHSLTSVHIFDQDARWTVFGFRKDAKGYQASVEWGNGVTISQALGNLDARLIEGPIHK